MKNKYTVKWLIFEKYLFPNRKTSQWQVTSTKGVYLGDIKWFGRWRTYAFFPECNTVYTVDCLQDILNFILKLKENRKNEKNII